MSSEDGSVLPHGLPERSLEDEKNAALPRPAPSSCLHRRLQPGLQAELQASWLPMDVWSLVSVRYGGQLRPGLERKKRTLRGLQTPSKFRVALSTSLETSVHRNLLWSLRRPATFFTMASGRVECVRARERSTTHAERVSAGHGRDRAVPSEPELRVRAQCRSLAGGRRCRLRSLSPADERNALRHPLSSGLRGDAVPSLA